MRNGKYMDDYNYHDWVQYMVRLPNDKPKGPHFAAVLFESRDEWIRPYDHHDDPGGTYSKFEYVQYFAFPDVETLREWVLRASKDNKTFFFFEVKQLGSAQLKVSVDIGM